MGISVKDSNTGHELELKSGCNIFVKDEAGEVHIEWAYLPESIQEELYQAASQLQEKMKEIATRVRRRLNPVEESAIVTDEAMSWGGS